VPIEFSRPILGFVAYSGTGKTTLLEQLIPALRARGLRIALLKHAHHDFDIDIPGKDSYRLRKAGATQVMVASARRWALVNENDDDHDEPQLAELLQQLDPSRFDLLLVEGFKHEKYPKIELWRSELAKPLLYPHDHHIIALACDRASAVEPAIPRLNLNDIATIAEFIDGWLAAQTASTASTATQHNG
jgi:molybdopterin-guanine dinucleotide biosynthesis protein MobB